MVSKREAAEVQDWMARMLGGTSRIATELPAHTPYADALPEVATALPRRTSIILRCPPRRPNSTRRRVKRGAWSVGRRKPKRRSCRRPVPSGAGARARRKSRRTTSRRRVPSRRPNVRKRSGAPRFVLQILDTHGQWRKWGPILANGLDVGRVPSSIDFPDLNGLAVRHLRFRHDHETLVVDDLGA